MSEQFHDAQIAGIGFHGMPNTKDLTIDFVLMTSERVRCTFVDVVAFAMDSVWEQNIILSLEELPIERAADADIGHAFLKNDRSTPRDLEVARATLKGLSARLYRLVPSRGMEACIFAKSFKSDCI